MPDVPKYARYTCKLRAVSHSAEFSSNPLYICIGKNPVNYLRLDPIFNI